MNPPYARTLPTLLAALVAVLPCTAAIAAPPAELHIARVMFASADGDRAFRPWWAIDYPEAEYHLTQGLERLTVLDVAGDSVHLQLTDDAIFDHPWLFVQQIGRSALTEAEIERLGDYIRRGGFVVIDDFHGPGDWAVMQRVLGAAVPDWPIERLSETHALMTVFYDLDQSAQIPGRRHLYRDSAGRTRARLQGPAEWHGVTDEAGRLAVAINFNMDMGDAWEHADDPVYPLPMTALAYRFAVNYVVYAMTH